MFGATKDAVAMDLLKQVQTLNKEIAALRGKRETISEELGLSEQVKRLMREVETLKIEKARQEEEQNRREREVEHKVGLERKRQEFEVEQAKREALVAVREENLEADRNRFEEQMKFTASRFEDEVGYLKEIMTEIMRRLPEISVTQRLSGVANGDGHDDAD